MARVDVLAPASCRMSRAGTSAGPWVEHAISVPPGFFRLSLIRADLADRRSGTDGSCTALDVTELQHFPRLRDCFVADGGWSWRRGR